MDLFWLNVNNVVSAQLDVSLKLPNKTGDTTLMCAKLVAILGEGTWTLICLTYLFIHLSIHLFWRWKEVDYKVFCPGKWTGDELFETCSLH